MIRRCAAVALGAVAVLGACTDAADSLDTAATERAVERAVEPRLGTEVDEVRCPSPIPRGGEPVTCRVVLAGTGTGTGATARVRVTARQDGDRVDVELVDAVVDPAQVGRELHQALVAEYARSFTVDCGDGEVVVAAPGATIPCTAADDAGRRKVTATVVDTAGTLSFDLGGTGS